MALEAQAFTHKHQAVDVVPFSAKQFWSGPQDYEIWWEDPRDIYRVVLREGQTSITGDTAPRLEYWVSSWPRVRVPKGAVVGAGESGWLANDDWTNGRWQPADSIIQREGNEWIFTFRPLNIEEFPEEQDFPAMFRRTLKLRIHFSEPGVKIDHTAAYTDSVWQEADLVIQWRAPEAGDMEQPALAAWDGALEAFNGQVLQVQPLNDCTQAVNGHQWQSAVPHGESSGVTARLRFASNEDKNSFDRTIVTLRSPGLRIVPGLSFYMDDALGDEPVYVRDLGILVHKAGHTVDLLQFEQNWQAQRSPNLYERIQEMPEQTWERSWANMARKTSGMYFTLGCEGSRQKFGVDPTGEIFMWENYIRRVPGKDTDKLDWDGRQLRFRFGFPQTPSADRSILEGYLPVIKTVWLEDELVYEQEAYADWLTEGDRSDHAGDDPVVLLARVRFTNLSDAVKSIRFSVGSIVDDKQEESLVAAADGWVTTGDGRLRLHMDTRGQGSLNTVDGQVIFTVDLAPNASNDLILKIPHVQRLTGEEKTRLHVLDYETGREQVAEFWRERTAQGAQIETPNATINNFYKTHLMHMLVINDREPGSDRRVARCGGFHYGSFPDEGCMVINDLDRRGYTDEAERCLDLYVQYQGTVPLPGNYQSQEGVLYGSGGYEVAGYNRNHGWILWTLVEHYRFTRDRAWLERIAPTLVKGCDWLIRERQVTRQDEQAIQYGFLPSGSLEDVTDYWTWLATNAYAIWGFRAAVEALAEIGHAETGRLRDEMQLFEKELKAGFYEACARSPVVRLRDGRWVPHFTARQERRGRDFGWLREVLEGPCHLIYCGLIPFDSPEARWIIDDYEDNLFLSEQYGYQADDFERQWFDWGGFSMQSNLLLLPPIYLWRDDIKHYLRGYFNGFTSAFFPDTVTMCEHALPDLAHWRGDHFKSSDEANSNSWLRMMFLAEYGGDLFVGQAIPRNWFEHGKTMRVERALTYFGQASLTFESYVATGLVQVTIDPPHRNPPRRIFLRVRHPQAAAMESVWVNGRPHKSFDPEREIIILDSASTPELPGGPLNIRVLYSDNPGEITYN